MLTEYIKAIIYGIVEGICEWLPISSTGHLILLSETVSFDMSLFGGEAEYVQFMSLFNLLIQLAAMLAAVCFYFRRLLPCRGSLTLYSHLIAATVPTALIGLLADSLVERFTGRSIEQLLFTPAVVASALIIYGILFGVVEYATKAKRTTELDSNDITITKALCLGLFQSLALIPGTSRSGATILGARLLGLPRATAAEFSFLMAIPVIACASALELFDFCGSGVSFSTDAIAVLGIACLVSFLLSLAAIKFLTDFLKRHSFLPFGIYRIILGGAVLLFGR